MVQCNLKLCCMLYDDIYIYACTYINTYIDGDSLKVSGSVHYDHYWGHGSMQEDMLMELNDF